MDSNKKTPKFMLESKLEDLSLCDDLINLWSLREKNEGVVGVNNTSYGDKTSVDVSKKDSLDVKFFAGESKTEIKKYYLELKQIFDTYIEKYKFCNKYSAWGFKEHFNIQYYAPGGGFKMWHTERGCSSLPMGARHLVFMTYLNDVHDEKPYQGGTEWYYPKFKTKARKGNTIIWPSDWTFTHRGIVAPNQEKFIVTGWASFLN